ncbi:ubiquitin elongating factor core-domain-containing protein [Gautieria morchelliformis]|nr:ubiquitin elongating factor core-domain-containing protein [Gautieria morchelliformis]
MRQHQLEWKRGKREPSSGCYLEHMAFRRIRAHETAQKQSARDTPLYSERTIESTLEYYFAIPRGGSLGGLAHTSLHYTRVTYNGHSQNTTMSEPQPPRGPADDAERIRLKRLAKHSQLANAPQASTSSTPSTPPPPKPIPKPSPRLHVEPTKSPLKRKALPPHEHLDVDTWEDGMLTSVLKVTLDRSRAEQTAYDLVWLKELQLELEAEYPIGAHVPVRLRSDISDRLLIARLELNPEAMSDDLDFLPVLASLPQQQTVLEYLAGCWKRLNTSRSNLVKGGFLQSEVDTALSRLDKVRELIISYIGLSLQDPEMFPQPSGKPLGAPELLPTFLSLSSLFSPLSGPSSSASQVLLPTDLPELFTDLSSRFLDDGLEEIVGPIIRLLCFHPSLQRPEGLGGGDVAWRSIISALDCLVGVKGVASVITRFDEWCPQNASPAQFEHVSLMGPLLRLGVFNREWPQIAATYFSDPLKRSRQDVDTSNASLRGTLKSLQMSLFQIFNAIVRSSPASREGVLAYFARAVNLNLKRGGMQVDFATVASDAFMINLHTILLRFAEPFMDAKYSKMDRVDPEFYRRSQRLDVSEETRLKATSDEAAQWVASSQEASSDAYIPNFISEVFYLTAAFNHYGPIRTIQEHDGLGKELDHMQRHLDAINADTTWQGTPAQARVDAQVQAVKNEMAKIHQSIFAYQVQLTDPEYMDRNIGFTNFLSIWLIRLVDPLKRHPDPGIQLPLPQEIPTAFKMLPEYFVEDIVDYYLFLVMHQPQSLELSGKTELVDFVLTFLSSTWYITNPYLKSKLVQILFYGTIAYGRESHGLLAGILNSHPLALKHLMSCLTSFYIEVESTGTHTQFYDKFDTRRHIAHIWKTVWTNPVHREALSSQANDLDKFVRFVNLMMNDVTYLLDESLSKLTEIYGIQTEMEDQETWAAIPQVQRRERERLLHQLEGSATTYTALGKSTVELLKEFTAETKQPFMTPEIVDRLAAMLNYNLDALVGPKCQDLKVKNPEKYRFNPRQLLSDILQVFLNLSDQGEFVRAVAGEGRSYKKELFERAAGIAKRRFLKTDEEIEQLRLFALKVEEMKVAIEAEDDLGEIPDEFLDPLMYTLMRDPVTLPSSKAVVDRSTIKAHLLSDASDPFNRMPLKLEDVVSNVEVKAKIEAFLAERRSTGAVASGTPAEDMIQVDKDVQGYDIHFDSV